MYKQKHLDNSTYSMKQIFQTIAFAFHNGKIFLDLPDDVYAISNIGELDLNDFARIRITKDCD